MIRRIYVFTSLALLSFLVSGCDYYRYDADLEITVKGLLSGNPRDGLIVQVFYSREDARALFDPVTPVLETNEWGEVFIFGLDPGINYYVRVDALLDTSIRRTGTLRSGTNSCTIRVL